MAPPNKFRKETELVLNGHTYACRPTLDKIARIEGRYGAALPLVRRIGEGNVTQGELAVIVSVMLRGVHNAPRDTDIGELIFEQGVIPVSSNVVDFIASAITSEVTAKPEDEEGVSQQGNP
jgi:hypothetical protein